MVDGRVLLLFSSYSPLFIESAPSRSSTAAYLKLLSGTDVFWYRGDTRHHRLLTIVRSRMTVRDTHGLARHRLRARTFLETFQIKHNIFTMMSGD